MRRVAVYVEGQTEYIFVREFLQKWYDYDPSRLSFRCNRLRSDKVIAAPYDFQGTEDCMNYFEITDVGNDNSVLAKILKNESFIESAGFDCVVGLRDMYSKDYRKANSHSSEINPKLNERFIVGTAKSLENQKTALPISMHFAIMEVEAWILAMLRSFPSDVDPELAIYHPAAELKRLAQQYGGDYDKHENEVSAIMSHFTRHDFDTLMKSGRCTSFRKFVEALCGPMSS